MQFVFSVTDQAGLNTAIAAVDNAATAGSYTIDINGTITEGTDGGGALPLDLYAISLPAGVSLVVDGLGSGTLDGAGAYRGLLVTGGAVTIQNLTVADAVAIGGAGGADGGGGGAGLGGGLFVASGGTVTLSNASFVNDGAKGGVGGVGTSVATGGGGAGGGGLGGAGGSGSTAGGGGGGVGAGASGAANGYSGAGGVILGALAAGSGAGPSGGKAGGTAGGGGGAPVEAQGGGGGGGTGGGNGTPSTSPVGYRGGVGGFGGGGGGGYTGGAGGFGGGGGSGFFATSPVSFGGGGGDGGFGGGGGGGNAGGAGGFGAGAGANAGGGGGGGLGAGGDIFVQQGGVLLIEGGNLGAGTLTAGAGGAAGVAGGAGGVGAAFGNGIFIQGTQSVTLAPQGGQTLSISGVIADQSGSAGSTTSPGQGALVDAGAGVVTLAASNSFTGGTTIAAAGSTLDLAALGAAGTGAIVLNGAGDTLVLEAAALPNGGNFANTVAGFAAGDLLILPAFPFLVPGAGSTQTTASLSGTTLTVTNANLGLTDTLTLTGLLAGAVLSTVQIGSNGTGVVLACFAQGTRIATARGMVAVEALREGDLVATLLGERLRPIVWIGHRHVDCRRHANPARVWPVRIRHDAFGPGQPVRDLLLSPDHAVLLSGVLIPVRCLMNGETIVQEARNAVTYWHVELDAHDVVLAEGVAAESYLDTGNRGAFSEGGPALDLHADFANGAREARACAELVLHGPLLEAARCTLVERARRLRCAATKIAVG